MAKVWLSRAFPLVVIQFGEDALRGDLQACDIRTVKRLHDCERCAQPVLYDSAAQGCIQDIHGNERMDEGPDEKAGLGECERTKMA